MNWLSSDRASWEAYKRREARQKLIRVICYWVVFGGLTLGVALVPIHRFVLSSSRPASAQVYAFDLPVMFMGCFEYHLRSGETFGNWRIQQPMTMTVSNVHDVTIRDIWVEEGAWCVSRATSDSRQGDR